MLQEATRNVPFNKPHQLMDEAAFAQEPGTKMDQRVMN